MASGVSSGIVSGDGLAATRRRDEAAAALRAGDLAVLACAVAVLFRAPVRGVALVLDMRSLLDQRPTNEGDGVAFPTISEHHARHQVAPNPWHA
jgi:hypothetical protein